MNKYNSKSLTQNLDALFEVDNYSYFHSDSFHAESRTRQEVAFIRDQMCLNKEMVVLDLACGHGRHTNALAPAVSRIIGIDRSEEFISLARTCARLDSIENVTYVHGDIHHTDYNGEFDGVLLLNTVLGLAQIEKEIMLMKRISRALKPSGLFCFDVINRDTILVDLQPHYIYEKDGDFMLDRLSFDEQTGRMENARVYIRRGVVVNAPFSLRLYNYTEINDLLTSAGLEIVKVFADWLATPMTWNSKKMVIIAQVIQSDKKSY